MSESIAENVDERGVLKIHSLVAKYGLQETLEAVFLEVNDEPGNGNKGEPDYDEAKRVHAKLDRLVGWRKPTGGRSFRANVRNQKGFAGCARKTTGPFYQRKF